MPKARDDDDLVGSIYKFYDRLVAAKDRDWRNREHYCGIAAKAMLLG
jgi:hypothetical protein